MVVYLARIFNPLGPAEFEEFNPGFLAVDETGRIKDYGEWDREAAHRWRDAELLDYRPRLICPGFIDVHLHLPQLDARGRDGAELLEWLERYIYPAERAFKDPEVARATARRLLRELVANGVTIAGIYSSVHYEATEAAFAEAAEFGYRALIGKVLMDRNTPPDLREPADEGLAASIALCERWHGHDGRLFYAFTPRFAPACSEELLRRAAQAAHEHKAYIQTHLSENERELETVRQLFPNYSNYTEVYFKTGVLGPRTIVGHAIHLSEEEYELLARTGTKVAHCPSSNLFLHSGRMRLEEMDRHGIAVALGSDIGAGPSLSPFAVMRDMYYLNTVTPVRAFYHATLAGAYALGLADKIGNFAVGKEADFVVLDPSALVDPEADIRTVLAQLIFRGDDRQVVATYVRGRKLHEK